MPFDLYIPICILLVQDIWDCLLPNIAQAEEEQPDIEVLVCVREDLVAGCRGRYPYSNEMSVEFDEDKPDP